MSDLKQRCGMPEMTLVDRVDSQGMRRAQPRRPTPATEPGWLTNPQTEFEAAFARLVASGQDFSFRERYPLLLPWELMID